jgi:hypothetical protein
MPQTIMDTTNSSNDNETQQQVVDCFGTDDPNSIGIWNKSKETKTSVVPTIYEYNLLVVAFTNLTLLQALCGQSRESLIHLLSLIEQKETMDIMG